MAHPRKESSTMLNLTRSLPSATASSTRAQMIENLRRFADRAARTPRSDVSKCARADAPERVAAIK
jgi:hypothetical protein